VLLTKNVCKKQGEEAEEEEAQQPQCLGPPWIWRVVCATTAILMSEKLNCRRLIFAFFFLPGLYFYLVWFVC